MMKRRIHSHLVIFLASLCILSGCLILTPPRDDNPFIKMGNLELPGMCTFRSVTGVPCPGCGLFRSMVSVMHGDMAGGFRYHRLGPITVLYLMLQFIFRLGVLIFPFLAIRFSLVDYYLNKGILLLAVLFGANWIVTLIRTI